MTNPLGLGVDTGGTYTDAVILDFSTGEVVAKAKALTTRPNLAEGILQAMDVLGAFDAEAIRLVSISTTLATNAMVEGRGGRVALLAIGYDPRILEQHGVRADSDIHRLHVIPGGHSVMGVEQRPLDRDAVLAVVARTCDEVDAYAVSAVGGVRNPEHEQQTRELIKGRVHHPVICGHELTSELGSIRRAVTAAFNARLLPLIGELIEAVQRALAERQIHAPLMVVKGDGHMMSAGMAALRPIETILSGPAASVVGGYFLSRQADGVVIDMGGTTTDIAIVRDGSPALNREGASVGGWRTCIRAADIRTSGIGGDSHIRIEEGTVRLSPQRVVPLSLAAAQYPEFLEQLRVLHRKSRFTDLISPTDALIRLRTVEGLPERSQRLVESLEAGPKLLLNIAREQGFMHPSLIDVKRLEQSGAVQRIGLTPTDILHVEGTYSAWCAEAASLAARIYAYQLEQSVDSFIKEVRQQIDRKLAVEVLSKLMSEHSGHESILGCRTCETLVDYALQRNGAERALRVQLSSDLPLVAIGAPVTAYFPRVAERLHAGLEIPPHAEVANAVGAVAGSIVESVEAMIQPVYAVAGISHYVVSSPAGIERAERIDQALALANQTVRRLIRTQIERAGAAQFEVHVEQQDQEGSIFLGMTVRAVAVGKRAFQ